MANRFDSAIEALLELESARALEDATASFLLAGEEVAAAADVRRKIREHPLLAAGIAAAVGWIGGPLAARLVRRSTATVLALGGIASLPGVPHGFARTAMRLVRSRR